ncbi:MAG: Grx4 family monothiol glutaredoxin [Pseudomonadota bacterium]
MSETTIRDDIQSVINSNDVVLFMKGTKSFPQCGFSSRVASILQYMDVAFHDVNVLENDGLRQGIKDFSDWPTIPQLYLKGEFLGGCDIITEMTLSGELDDAFAAKGISFNKEAIEQIRAQNAQ